MGTACSARCEGSGASYKISFDPQYRSGISKEMLSKLQAQHPDVYDDFVETKEIRIFKLTKAAS